MSNGNYVTRKTPGDTDWFVDSRLGMFIHWGLYSMPARHEWIKRLEPITDQHYDKYFKYFNPDLYDPKKWAADAKAAGMKYVILTTKHHEGFCLWDTQYTDYKATNTPAGRDLVKEYVDAFRAEGIRIGFYYSLIDWHHPHFTVDPNHPYIHQYSAEEIRKINAERDMHIYAKYMRDQVTELLTNYGPIDILWFDYSYESVDLIPGKEEFKGKGAADWESEELIATARKLAPNIIIDNRAGIEQDLWTPEQVQPRGWEHHKETNELVVWEACQTFSGSWGYHRDESTWKSGDMLVKMLIDTVSKGGNLLLNVGPTSRGEFDYRATDALNQLGKWMHQNSRSIYGCTASEFTPPQDCRYTQNGNRLYLHLFSWNFGEVYLPEMAGKIDYMQMLHDGSEIRFSEELENTPFGLQLSMNENEVRVVIPVKKPDVTVPVIEIFLKDETEK